MTSNHNNRQRNNRPTLVPDNSKQKSEDSEPKLVTFDSLSSPTQPVDTSNFQPLNLSSSQSQNESQSQNQKKGTGTSGASGLVAARAAKAASAKLAAEEVKFGKLEEDVTKLLQETVVGICMLIGGATKDLRYAADGLVIAKHSRSYAACLVSLAKQYEVVYTALKWCTETTAIGEVISETAVIGVAIAAIHGANIPPMVPGASEGVECLIEVNAQMKQVMEAQAQLEASQAGN